MCSKSRVELDARDMDRIWNSMKKPCFVGLTLKLCKHFYSQKIKLNKKGKGKEKN